MKSHTVGESRDAIFPELRPGNSHIARWSVNILGMIVDKIRTRFPDMRIVLRTDAGYSSAALYRKRAQYALFHFQP